MFIRVSYEHDEELETLLDTIRRIMTVKKIKRPPGDGKTTYKKAYITVEL